ncbi:hypothetical protein [Acidiphilium rubrum]|uniref:hypothetical protein n=1 Tax=Acidiphilium rubrum TaxID=526 RepID=UPI002C1C2753|nr:hypothetical protein [Acidiphilium rubrum]HQT86805.1 hypothetical protein [Acidiphilium rubrum]
MTTAETAPPARRAPDPIPLAPRPQVSIAQAKADLDAAQNTLAKLIAARAGELGTTNEILNASQQLNAARTTAIALRSNR